MKHSRLILVVLILLTLTGCWRKEPSTVQTKQVVIGVAQVGAESDWRVANSESIKNTFTAEKGYRLLFEDAKQKKENQIMAVRKFIQQKVDYIVLMPIEESGWNSVLQEAKKAGIPVILVDRMVDEKDETLYAARVGSDFLKEGELAVQYLAKRFSEIDRDVNIVHIRGTLNSTPQVGRTKALEDGAEAHDNWNIMCRLDGDFTQAKSYETLKAWLEEKRIAPNIDVVYCENDNEAFGAIQALKEAGYVVGKNGICVVSFDATANALKSCMAGEISMTVECNPLLGAELERVIQELEAGTLSTKTFSPEEKAYSRENLTQQIITESVY